MSASVIYPVTAKLCDEADEVAAGGEVGWFVGATMPQEGCALCAIGCCVQRVVSDMDADALIIHQVAGRA